MESFFIFRVVTLTGKDPAWQPPGCRVPSDEVKFRGMRFRYLAATPGGGLQKGEMEAASVQEVAERLREKSLVPVEIKEARGFVRFRLKRGRTEELLLFTEQLHRLLKAGVPLDRALEILGRVFGNTGQRELERLSRLLTQELKEGRRLSEALAAEGFFPEFYVSLVRAGEVSGALEEVLADLSRYLRQREEFRRELLSALLYPAFLLFFGLFAVQTVMVYVLPRFAVIFEEMGVEPPAFTRLLISAGLFWKDWGFVFLILLAAAFFYLRHLLSSPAKRQGLEQRLLRLPFFGRLWLLSELARVFRALAVMLRGGVAIEQALKMAASVPSLLLLREFFSQLAEEIKHGQRLSGLLQRLPVRADFVLDLVTIGEETGNLSTSFADIAELCE
jgi:type II secretory pathway component PulF